MPFEIPSNNSNDGSGSNQSQIDLTDQTLSPVSYEGLQVKDVIWALYSLMPQSFPSEEQTNILNNIQMQFDQRGEVYIHELFGKPLNIYIRNSSKVFSSYAYDLLYGSGAAQQAVNQLRLYKL